MRANVASMRAYTGCLSQTLRSMLHLRISAEASITPEVLVVLSDQMGISSLGIMRGASIEPAGDVITADVARESANDVIDRLLETGVHTTGTIHLNDVSNWISQPAFEAEKRAPGDGSDAVVWSDVVQDSYESSKMTWSFLSFMVLSTLMASIAIVLDSQILVISAMVLGPEFGAVAALGLALVRKRGGLFGRAIRTLAIGYLVAIAATTFAVILGRILGWIGPEVLYMPRPGTEFIYTPDKWSLVVAVLAGIAGVLAITSNRAGGLVGVFISVTTIPAAGNIAIGLAFLYWPAIRGSLAQLIINLIGMAIAGWATLLFQQFIWRRVAQRRDLSTRLMTHFDHSKL